MVKTIVIILILVLTGSPVAAQEEQVPSTPDKLPAAAGWDPCQGEADRCYAWQGKLEHCQSAVVSFHYSPYEMDLTHISAVLENIKVAMPGRPDAVRKIASLESKGPGRLRVLGDPVTVQLEPGCELELSGYDTIFPEYGIFTGYPTGQLTCSMTFDDEYSSWTAEIGSADIIFKSVAELPPLETE